MWQVHEFDVETGSRSIAVYGVDGCLHQWADGWRSFAVYRDEAMAWAKVSELSAKFPGRVFGIVSNTMLSEKLRKAREYVRSRIIAVQRP